MPELTEAELIQLADHLPTQQVEVHSLIEVMSARICICIALLNWHYQSIHILSLIACFVAFVVIQIIRIGSQCLLLCLVDFHTKSIRLYIRSLFSSWLYIVYLPYGISINHIILNTYVLPVLLGLFNACRQ